MSIKQYLSFQELIRNYGQFEDDYVTAVMYIESQFDSVGKVDFGQLRAAHLAWIRLSSEAFAAHRRYEGRLSSMITALIEATSTRPIVTFEKRAATEHLQMHTETLIRFPNHLTGLTFGAFVYAQALKQQGTLIQRPPFHPNELAAAAASLADNPKRAVAFRRILNLKKRAGLGRSQRLPKP